MPLLAPLRLCPLVGGISEAVTSGAPGPGGADRARARPAAAATAAPTRKTGSIFISFLFDTILFFFCFRGHSLIFTKAKHLYVDRLQKKVENISDG